jgi:N-terminal acetyltransferase B complex catalytic subunit
MAVSPTGKSMGYMIGKAEGQNENWHGHVTAVTVAPEYRRIGLADKLMHFLEATSEKVYDAYFVDLFVRVGNKVAVGMYNKLGYVTYRRVLNYYSGEEDALDMRLALPRYVHKKSMIPLEHPVNAEDVD